MICLLKNSERNITDNVKLLFSNGKFYGLKEFANLVVKKRTRIKEALTKQPFINNVTEEGERILSPIAIDLHSWA